VQPLRSAGAEVDYGGPLGELARPSADERVSELIGFGVAVIVLLVGSGSVIAAVVPLLSALISVVGGLALLGLPAATFTFATVSPTLATLIGLGGGIDYALFMLTRHRQNLIDGMDPVLRPGSPSSPCSVSPPPSPMVLAIPLFSIQLGHIGDGADPTSSTDRRAYHLDATVVRLLMALGASLRRDSPCCPNSRRASAACHGLPRHPESSGPKNALLSFWPGWCG
jgi:hypothetical protein